MSMSWADEKRTTAALAVSVAEALGADWHAEPPGEDGFYGGYLGDTAGRRLHLGLVSGHQDRVSVGTVLGQSTFLTGKDRPSITVARQRGAAVIAAEIRRRILPEYDVLRAGAEAYDAEREVERIGRLEVAGRLAAMLGCRIHELEHEVDVTAYAAGTSSAWVTVTVRHDGQDIKVEARGLNAGDAGAMLGALVAGTEAETAVAGRTEAVAATAGEA